MVVAGLQAADRAYRPGLGADAEAVDEAHVGGAVVHAGEAAEVEAGPVDRGDDRRQRLHRRLARHHRGEQLRRELVADAGIAGPAVDVVAVAIIEACIAEPSGVGHLSGDAEGELAVGADARGAGGLRKGNRLTDGRIEEERVREGREARGDGAGEFVEHACRRERLEDDVVVLDRGADADAQAAQLAFDVVDAVGAGDEDPGRARRIEAVDLGVGIDETCRRLDEPVVGEREIIARRSRDRDAARTDRLVLVAVGRRVEVDVVVFLANQDVGKEAVLGRDRIRAPERYFELGVVAGEGVVGLAREIAGRGAEMKVPAVHVQSGDVLTDLETDEIALLVVVAVRGDRRVRRGEALHDRGSLRDRVALQGDFAADHAAPDAAAGLVRRGIRRRGNERAALLAEEDGVDVADGAGERAGHRGGRCSHRVEVVDAAHLREIAIRRDAHRRRRSLRQRTIGRQQHNGKTSRSGGPGRTPHACCENRGHPHVPRQKAESRKAVSAQKSRTAGGPVESAAADSRASRAVNSGCRAFPATSRPGTTRHLMGGGPRARGPNVTLVTK